MPAKKEIKMLRKELVGRNFIIKEITERVIMIEENLYSGERGMVLEIEAVDEQNGFGPELEISRMVRERLG